jgi:rare lipoprotein A
MRWLSTSLARKSRLRLNAVPRSPATALLLLLLLASLAACGSNKAKDGPPRSGSVSIPELPGDAIPRPEPRSRYGNGPVYEVFGQRYTVLNSSAGYKERGVASWYGNKFHGKLTSNQEVYDMHAMTAAHKSLPLPSYVRVRNLRNNKSVVVRVNDRGPFVDNRIIDLSYSAARKLDMIKDGTSLVEVEAISFDKPAGDRVVRQTTPRQPPAATPQTPVSNEIYVQVGAFGSRENAQRRLGALRSSGIGNSFILEDTSGNPILYRVRIGPIKGVVEYDILVEELENRGINDPYLVTE